MLGCKFSQSVCLRQRHGWLWRTDLRLKHDTQTLVCCSVFLQVLWCLHPSLLTFRRVNFMTVTPNYGHPQNRRPAGRSPMSLHAILWKPLRFSIISTCCCQHVQETRARGTGRRDNLRSHQDSVSNKIQTWASSEGHLRGNQINSIKTWF